MEAIIGAALVSGGERLAFSAAKTLGFDVPKACDWLDVVSHAPSKTTGQQELDDKVALKGIMKIIGGTLENPSLLLQAVVGAPIEQLCSGFNCVLASPIFDRLI